MSFLVCSGLWAYASSLPIAHRAVVEVLVPASPEGVRGRVQNWRESSTWKPEVTEIVDLGVVDGHQRFWECAAECLDIEVVEDGDVWVTRIVDHPDFGGTWTWTFEPAPDGTNVVVIEDGVVYNPVFRFFMHHVFGADATLRATTAALRASFTR